MHKATLLRSCSLVKLWASSFSATLQIASLVNGLSLHPPSFWYIIWVLEHVEILADTHQFVFAALAAGSYGAHGSINGMLSALAAYRFLLGIGIGGEYPAGSVGCSESTGELESGTRNRWFIWFTNLAIDVGFVVAAFVPMVVVSYHRSLSHLN